MAPTLNNENRVLVNRAAYWFTPPVPGDVVMFSYPLDPRKPFVERLIAEGGDRVEGKDGRVFRNGVLVHDPYVSEAARRHDDWGPHEIPSGHYFVLADCRSNSSDSRHFGSVPSGYVLGRVWLRWWPTLERVGDPTASADNARGTCPPQP